MNPIASPLFNAAQTKPEIIGVCGYKRSGKDEVYNAIIKNFSGVHRFAFADPLKHELALACGVSTSFIELNKDAFRLGLQWWGTEFRRNLFGNDYWIKQAQEKLDSVRILDPNARIVVFTDCRFPNEADFIKQQGGHLWRVLRPGATGDEHCSERALDDYGQFNRLLRNVGTLEELHTQVIGLAVQDFNPANLAIAHEKLN